MDCPTNSSEYGETLMGENLGYLDDAQDEHWMQLALAQARLAGAKGEVPVGAVVVLNGRVVGEGHNQPIADHDPSAHAEVVALRAAAKNLANYRLEGCELFVTLEPCAMCAGAILHGRLKRMVFGAPDPKAGAAGGVLNLFSVAALNHHTQARGGVLAEECAHVLTDFFANKRQEQSALAKANMPLRDDALRTPEGAFSDLPDFPWRPHYVADLPSLKGLRQHYLDEGPRDATEIVVCLHGAGYWAYAFRQWVEQALANHLRIIVPDQIGFGKSDKPKKSGFHTRAWHQQNLLELLAYWGVRSPIWMLQDERPWGYSSAELLPIAGQTVMMARPDDHPHALQSAWSLPFPNAGYKAGLRAFSLI